MIEPDWSELVDDCAGLLLRRVVVGPLDTNCYIITSIPGRRSILVDPGDDAATILDAVTDVDIELVVLTHAHFDHVQGVAEISDALGAPIAAHPDDAPVWPHELDHLRQHGHFDAGTATTDLLAAGCPLCPPPDRTAWDGHVHHLLHHGDVINVDRLVITALHTPGHTPGGISLHLPGCVLRRHPVPRRPRAHRPAAVGLPDHPPHDRTHPPHSAAGHHRPPRPRPPHHHRRRAPQPR